MSTKRFKWPIVLAVVGLLAVGGTLISAAGEGARSTASAPGKLVIDNVSGSTWTCQFNPFNPALLGPGITFALVYEPLEFVNILQSGKPPVPMLASSSQWSNGYKTLTFTIRQGVTWSDGKPLTSADVEYTFNAMKSD